MENESIDLEKDNEKAKGNKITARIKIIYEFWLYIRAKVEEIMEPVLFFGGGTLTALIALGILPWGALGIGICATLTFIGISRFVLTNSWTRWHNMWAKDKEENENKSENTENDNAQEDQEEYVDKEYVDKEEEEKQGTGFVTTSGVVSLLKFRFIPIILAITGITFGILGATGVLGLGLALGIAIPSLILVAMVLVLIGLDKRNRQLLNIQASDNFWGVSMLVAGLLSVATFAVLGLTGVLALPTAIALGAPGLALAGIMALIFVGTLIRYWIKNYKEESSIRLCSFIGLSWNPDFVLSKPKGARLSRTYFNSKTGEYEKHIIPDKS